MWRYATINLINIIYDLSYALDFTKHAVAQEGSIGYNL